MRPDLPLAKWMRTCALTILCAASLAGCAGAVKEGVQKTGVSRAEQCRSALHLASDLVADRDQADAQYDPVAGYPHYRIDRLHASFRDDLKKNRANMQMSREWLTRLAGLATEARNLEIANLSTRDQNLLRRDLVGLDPQAIAQTSQDYLAKCASLLTEIDLNTPGTVDDIVEGASVPDRYSTAARIAGGYWATRWLSLAGNVDWQEEMRGRYASEKLDARRLIQMHPRAADSKLSAAEIGYALRKAGSQNPLGIPELDAALLSGLTRQFAPTLEIAPATLSDLIGSVQWNRRDRVDVSVSKPAVYTMHSYTRWRKQTLLQLNYVFWFPRRTATGLSDPYAGKLDGLIWRVTLGSDGRPVFYDAIHTCGCYHMVFPLKKDMLARRASVGKEGSLVFGDDIPDAGEQSIVLEVSPQDHQIIGLRALTAADAKRAKQRSYAMHAYAELRSLPVPGKGRRSMFNTAGLVDGSERGERMFLWPMGVASAGAMRQWGHHAISLAGKRHFDDPDLMKDLFYRAWR